MTTSAARIKTEIVQAPGWAQYRAAQGLPALRGCTPAQLEAAHRALVRPAAAPASDPAATPPADASDPAAPDYRRGALEILASATPEAIDAIAALLARADAPPPPPPHDYTATPGAGAGAGEPLPPRPTTPARTLTGLSAARSLPPVECWGAPDAPAPDPHYSLPPLATLATLAAWSATPWSVVWLWGPPGTGKSSLVRELCARTGRPCVEVALDGDRQAADLIGGMGLRDQQTTWQDGVITAAIRRPGTILVLDEVDAASPGVLMALRPLLDHRRALTLTDTGECVPCAEGVRIMLTSNTSGHGDTTGTHTGTHHQGAATADRAIKVQVGYLPAADEAAALDRRTGVGANTATTLVSYAGRTRQAPNISAGLSPRRLIDWCALIAVGLPPEHATEVALLGPADPADRPTLASLAAACLPPAWLPTDDTTTTGDN